MFTGIVEDLGIAQGINKTQLSIETELSDIKVSDSISVNGVCLTVVHCAQLNTGHSLLTFDISSETFNCTNLGKLKNNEKVNLERAVTANSRLGGHVVTGHIECTGKILSIKTDVGNKVFSFSVAKEIMKYVVPKGAITVDGISFTVVDVKPLVGESRFLFTVSVIPYTFKNTTLGFKKTGSIVNIEPDIMAKYAEKALGARTLEKKGITVDFLKETGFLW